MKSNQEIAGIDADSQTTVRKSTGRAANLLAACLKGMLFLVIGLRPSYSQTLYEETFDGGTPGQSLTNSPFNWTAAYGNISIDTTTHPGWSGNAVVGNSALMPEGYQGSLLRRPVSNLPTNGVLTISFDAWACDCDYGAYIGLYSGPLMLFWSPWHFTYDGGPGYVWVLQFSDGGNYEVFSWQSPSDAMRNVTVHGTISVDFDNLKAWGQLTTGADTLATPQLDLPGGTSFDGVFIYEDRRNESPGADFDNLKVQAVPRPNALISVTGGGGVTIAWESVPDVTYRVDYCSDLASGAWLPLVACIRGDGTTQSVGDTVSAGPAQRFYRVVVDDCVP